MTDLAPHRTSGRDTLGTAAVVAAVISFAGFVVLVIGHALAPHDFNNGKHPTAANNVAFFAYVGGLLIALVLGGAVTAYRRRSGAGRNQAAFAALVYGVVFLVVAIVLAALGA